jgi:hypothetical protein
MATCRSFVLGLCLILTFSAPAAAQGTSSSQDDGWRVTVYPVLAWLPTHISIEVNLPPVDGGVGGNGGGGEIIDSRFDGAYLGGFASPTGRGAWMSTASGRPSAAIASSARG